MLYPALILYILTQSAAFGQVNLQDSSLTISVFSASVGFQVPGGDLVDRFGSNFTVGGSFMVKTKKNWEC